MKVAVVGAGGHIGNAVVRELGDRGWEVTAVTRTGQATENLVGLPVKLKSGSIRNANEARGLVADQDLIVDASAPYLLKAHETPEHTARAESLRLQAMLNASKETGACFAFVSSSVTLPRDRSTLGEAQRALLAELHPYFTVKKALEEQVLAAANSGLDVCVINPTACLGPWDPKPPHLCYLPLLLNGRVPATTSHPLNILDVRDVARLLLQAIEERRFGTPLALSGHNSTVEVITSVACQLARVPAPRWQVPAGVAAGLAYAAERLMGRWSYPSLGFLLLLEEAWVEQTAVQRSLGVRLNPMSRTILDAIRWYQSRGLLATEKSQGSRATTEAFVP